MVLPLAEILAAPRLHLIALTGSPEALQRPVSWCSVTELADPRPWLQGGELVLTTGLRQRTAAAQREFVELVARRGVSGIGFGTGLTHERVPRMVITTARAYDLPVLEVPYETPFLAVDRFVADRIAAESYGRQRDLLRMHHALARALLSGGGLDGLVHTLAQLVGAPVAVTDAYGAVLAATPPGGEWPAGQDAPIEVADVEVADIVVAHLRTPAEHEVLPYAASLVGLELARRQAVLAGRRELVGQVIEDIVRASLSESEAAKRLSAFGVDAARPHTVLLAAAGRGVDPGGDRLRSLPGGVYPLSAAGAEPIVTAYLGEHLVVVVGEGRPVDEVARQTLGYVGRLGESARVGIGGAYPGAAGLRWSFYEAREALSRGPGINGREPLSLPGLLLASEALPLTELGRAVLAPLLDFDEQGGGDLVATLRAYLEEDGSVARVASRLFVHRNTVRYRLEQIERLTGRSLASTQDRVQFWLALQAVTLGAR
ncbi:PucR family transcriptional regulator [Planosporangium thailandense]|uniref:PucR family transcriptional regulator n=1 Tax=Planosporangium thailandense TaxID=765197 RepID=A0ABX0Y555_9ACTN|nr:PucR family transcriptional regulator [Planosporangium thailandense]NJC72522.1 PucR family transcriptional regulator [Planosporangium thailandense]